LASANRRSGARIGSFVPATLPNWAAEGLKPAEPFNLPANSAEDPKRKTLPSRQEGFRLCNHRAIILVTIIAEVIASFRYSHLNALIAKSLCAQAARRVTTPTLRPDSRYRLDLS
jgi:hypothetical protein